MPPSPHLTATVASSGGGAPSSASTASAQRQQQQHSVTATVATITATAVVSTGPVPPDSPMITATAAVSLGLPPPVALDALAPAPAPAPAAARAPPTVAAAQHNLLPPPLQVAVPPGGGGFGGAKGPRPGMRPPSSSAGVSSPSLPPGALASLPSPMAGGMPAMMLGSTQLPGGSAEAMLAALPSPPAPDIMGEVSGSLQLHANAAATARAGGGGVVLAKAGAAGKAPAPKQAAGASSRQPRAGRGGKVSVQPLRLKQPQRRGRTSHSGAGHGKWSHEEEMALAEAVKANGVGKWKEILADPSFMQDLHLRNNVDLKDKWRLFSRGPSRQDLEAIERGSGNFARHDNELLADNFVSLLTTQRALVRTPAIDARSEQDLLRQVASAEQPRRRKFQPEEGPNAYPAEPVKRRRLAEHTLARAGALTHGLLQLESSERRDNSNSSTPALMAALATVEQWLSLQSNVSPADSSASFKSSPRPAAASLSAAAAAQAAYVPTTAPAPEKVAAVRKKPRSTIDRAVLSNRLPLCKGVPFVPHAEIPVPPFAAAGAAGTDALEPGPEEALGSDSESLARHAHYESREHEGARLKFGDESYRLWVEEQAKQAQAESAAKAASAAALAAGRNKLKTPATPAGPSAHPKPTGSMGPMSNFIHEYKMQKQKEIDTNLANKSDSLAHAHLPPPKQVVRTRKLPQNSPCPISDMIHAHFALAVVGKGVDVMRRVEYGTFLNKIEYFAQINAAAASAATDLGAVAVKTTMDGAMWQRQCRALGANGAKGVTMRNFRLLYTKWGRNELNDYRKAVGEMTDAAAAEIRAKELAKKLQPTPMLASAVNAAAVQKAAASKLGPLVVSSPLTHPVSPGTALQASPSVSSPQAFGANSMLGAPASDAERRRLTAKLLASEVPSPASLEQTAAKRDDEDVADETAQLVQQINSSQQPLQTLSAALDIASASPDTATSPLARGPPLRVAVPSLGDSRLSPQGGASAMDDGDALLSPVESERGQSDGEGRAEQAAAAAEELLEEEAPAAMAEEAAAPAEVSEPAAAAPPANDSTPVAAAAAAPPPAPEPVAEAAAAAAAAAAEPAAPSASTAAAAESPAAESPAPAPAALAVAVAEPPAEESGALSPPDPIKRPAAEPVEGASPSKQAKPEPRRLLTREEVERAAQSGRSPYNA